MLLAALPAAGAQEGRLEEQAARRPEAGRASREPAQRRVWAPAPGSPTRRAILDAVRREARTRATFMVAHLAISGEFAFARAGEVVPDGPNLQETDFFVEALLWRTRPDRWEVLELWNLATEGGRDHDVFLERVRRRMAASALPAELLPDDLREAGRR